MLCIHTFFLKSKSTHTISCLIHSTFNIRYWWRFVQQQPFQVRDPVRQSSVISSNLARQRDMGGAFLVGQCFLCEGFEHFWKNTTRLEQIFWSRWVILNMIMRYEILNALRNRWMYSASLYSSFFREGDWLASESRFAGPKPKQKKKRKKESPTSDGEHPTTSWLKISTFCWGFPKNESNTRVVKSIEWHHSCPSEKNLFPLPSRLVANFYFKIMGCSP